MFPGVLNTVFLNISNHLPHLELRNHSIQIVVITNFVVISNVGIKRFNCIGPRYIHTCRQYTLTGESGFLWLLAFFQVKQWALGLSPGCLTS